MSYESSPGPEARVFRRTELFSDVELEIQQTDAASSARTAEGRMMDVGVGGILVHLDESVPQGTSCTIRFTDSDVGDLAVRGYVRSVRADDAGYLHGIEFEKRIEALRTPSDDDHLEGFQLDATRILVVDDEPSVVELLVRFLSSRGCDVTTASNGEEALDKLRRGGQDITVLDLKMPDLDGLEVLQRIRDEQLDAGAVWVVSGYASDAEAREALRQGAADFIAKPLDLKYLEWSMQLHRAAV